MLDKNEIFLEFLTFKFPCVFYGSPHFFTHLKSILKIINLHPSNF